MLPILSYYIFVVSERHVLKQFLFNETVVICLGGVYTAADPNVKVMSTLAYVKFLVRSNANQF
jgi:shikimate kinase